MQVTAMNHEAFVEFLSKPNTEYEVSDYRAPGKFEGNEDQELAERLYDCTLDQSYIDDWVGDVQGSGWNARMGRFIVTENVQGFFSYTAYGSEDEARQEFEKIEQADSEDDE